VVGFGYFVDNLYPVVTGVSPSSQRKTRSHILQLILPPVLVEFSGNQGPWLKLAENIGLLLGATVWGLGSDIWGRRISFNITLLIVGVFGTAAGGSPNYTTLSAMTGMPIH
jgi:MFS family permease